MTKYKLPLYQSLAHIASISIIFYFDIYLFICSLLTYYLMISVGISAGFHRLLSHQTYKAPRWFKNLAMFIGTLGLQSTPLTWPAMHRQHHSFSDTEQDPHSPQYKGLFNTYFGVILFQPKLKYVKDLLRDKDVLFFHKNYFKINLFYDLILFLINPLYVVYFHLLPATILWHAEAAINVWTHTKYFGYRTYNTNDNSKNISLLGWLIAGEGYHNNHHNNPNYYNFAHNKYEYDVTAKLINFVKI